MAKSGDNASAAIQALLAERRKIEEWLQKLAAAGDKTAPDVRTRVQGDYEARLTKVVTELQGYSDDLRASLESQRAKFADFKSREAAATEELPDGGGADRSVRAVEELLDALVSNRRAKALEAPPRRLEDLARGEPAAEAD